MKVSDLKQLLESVPNDLEVMIEASAKDFILPVKSTGTGTVETLTDTGMKFMGIPVVGGHPVPAYILFA